MDSKTQAAETRPLDVRAIEPARLSASLGACVNIARAISKSIVARRTLAVISALTASLAFVCAAAVAINCLDHWFRNHNNPGSVATKPTPHDSNATGLNVTFGDCCRFAPAFESVDWRDEKTRALFIANALSIERRFFAAANVSYDPDTGMTWDSVFQESSIGDIAPRESSHASTPSKESLQLSLLALSLQSREQAGGSIQKLLSLVYSRDEALDLLETKIAALEDFNARYPGFGGFLPWFCPRGVKANGQCRDMGDVVGPMEPASDWQNKLPGIDNGQMAWAVVAVTHVLEETAALELKQQAAGSRMAKLASRYRQHLARMQSSAVNMFYKGAGSGAVRTIANVRNLSLPASASPDNFFSDVNFSLNDAYEGEMMVLFIDLLGNWSAYENNGLSERELIWQDKRRHVQKVNWIAPDGRSIPVQQGLSFSSREQWKILQLPYLELPLVKQIFANGERARLQHSLNHGIPGLFASCHAPSGVVCGTDGGYCSSAGIMELAAQPNLQSKAVTPYAAFPSMLLDPAAGLAWYNRMLALPNMQSPAGSLESVELSGGSVSPMLTWNAKATSVVAMLGGTGAIIRRYMVRENVAALFDLRVGGMYTSVFGSHDLHGSKGSAVKLPLPPAHLPVANQFRASFNTSFPKCVCEGQQRRLRLRGGLHQLP